MGFEFNPADEDPHGECRYEIQRLKLLSSKCDGCGLPELHKMCPAHGTDAYMNPEHEAWGSVDGIMDLKFGNKDAEIARLNAKLAAYERATMFCDDCQPGNGTVGGCLRCGLIELNAKLSQIDYELSEPNEMGCSRYDVHQNPDTVIERAKALKAKLTALRNGIAEVVQVQGEKTGEFLLWPLGHMHVNDDNEMVGGSPAGEKPAKLWKESE